MTRRTNRLAENFTILEDVEEDSSPCDDSFGRLRTPLLSSPATEDNNNSSSSSSNSNNISELRHRPSTAVSASASLTHVDGDSENQEQQRELQFQLQQQRILDRNGMFHQSRGRWGVERRLSTSPVEEGRTTGNQRCFRSPFFCCYRRIYQEWGKDWFYWLAYKKTAVLFLLLFFSYALIICFFGFIYLTLSIFGSKAEINPDGSTKTIAFCDMDINDHMEAMYFSLSTMTTIGYGVSDYYFGGCYSPLLIVLLQICTAIVFDAVAVGLIFHRISRGAKRSRSILFSDKAIIRNIRGVPHLMFRLGERRKHHLIEATVRCYCIRHERIPESHPAADENGEEQPCNNPRMTNREQVPVHVETTSFVSRQMRLVQPDDRFGSHLWMGLPQVVVHRIDGNSPLLPLSPTWYDVGAVPHRYPPVQERRNVPGAPSEEADDPLRRKGGGSSSSSLHSRDLESRARCIRDFLYDRDVEVVVLVDGTDEGTGAATQARHSYKLCDMAWNCKLAECVHPYRRRQRSGPSSLDPVVSIDFSRFHDVVPAPLDSYECAYVQNEAGV